MKIRITIEAELDEEATEQYPPDDPVLMKTNLLHYLREGWLILPLTRISDALCDVGMGAITNEMGLAMIKTYRLQEKLGRQFDKTFKVEILEGGDE